RARVAGHVEDDLVRLSGHRVERLLDAANGAAAADEVEAAGPLGRSPAGSDQIVDVSGDDRPAGDRGVPDRERIVAWVRRQCAELEAAVLERRCGRGRRTR